MRLGLVSGAYPPKLRSHINHRLYAQLHGLDYKYDTQRYENLQTPHFHKLMAVLGIIESYDWVMWLDEDAFFTDFSFDVTELVRSEPVEVFFVACKSPISPQGGWTFLNSGVFFVRNSSSGRKLLAEALSVPKSDVKAKWKPEIYGFLTRGEQAHVIHVLHKNGLLDHIRLHDFRAFNARPYHWPDGSECELYPVVHFPGSKNKLTDIDRFSSRFGRDSTMVPPELLARLGRPNDIEPDR